MENCVKCGNPIKTVTLGLICEDCKLWRYIPDWYSKAEEYVPGQEMEPSKATKTPESGVGYLDAKSTNFKFAELSLTTSEIKHMQHREQNLGVPNG